MRSQDLSIVNFSPLRVKLLPIILFIFLTGHAWSQDSGISEAIDSIEQATKVHDNEKEFDGAVDALKIETRSFSKTELEKLKSDEAMNYEQPPTIAESLWDRFKSWMAWLFSTLFAKATTTDLGRILLYTLAGVLLIVVIMAFLKVNAFRVFYSGADNGKQSYSVFHENIHEMDFEKLIREATEKKEYRLATRLVFLHALKLLSDKHLIDFNPGKTNHEYVDELKTPELKTGLNELSFYFDYAWYGNFSISDTQFQKIKNTFAEWKIKMN